MKLVLGSKSSKNGLLRRWLATAVAVGTATALLAACSSSSSPAASGGTGGGSGGGTALVALNPASGPVTGTPTWSTHAACPSGYQGSAIFRAVTPKGTTFSISGATNTVTAPFNGNLLAPISEIQSLSNAANGSTERLVIICFSGASLTGKPQWEWSTYITYSGDGKTYQTSSTS
jgi:hypothetical protein